MSPYFPVSPRIRLSGDKTKARSLIGFAKKQFMLMEWANVQNLPQMVKRFVSPDGTEVKIAKRFGLCEIDIFVPPQIFVEAPVSEEALGNVGIFYINISGVYYWLHINRGSNGVSFKVIDPLATENRLAARATSAKAILFNEQRFCLSPAGYVLKTMQKADLESESGFDAACVMCEFNSRNRIHSFAMDEYCFYSAERQSAVYNKVTFSTNKNNTLQAEVGDTVTLATTMETESGTKSTVAANQVTDVLTFMARDCWGSYYEPNKSPGRYIDIGFISPPLNYQDKYRDMGPLGERDLHNSTGTSNEYYFNYRNDIDRFAGLIAELTSETSALLVTETLQRLPSQGGQGDWLTPRFVHIAGSLEDVTYRNSERTIETDATWGKQFSVDFGDEAEVSGLNVDDQFEAYTHNIWTPSGFSTVEHGEHVYTGTWISAWPNDTETPDSPGYSSVSTVHDTQYLGCEVVDDRDLSGSDWYRRGILSNPIVRLTWKYNTRSYNVELEAGELFRKDSFPIGSEDDENLIDFHIASKSIFRWADGSMSLNNVGSVCGSHFYITDDWGMSHDFLVNNSVKINNSPDPNTGGIFTYDEMEDYAYWSTWFGRLVLLYDCHWICGWYDCWNAPTDPYNDEIGKTIYVGGIGSGMCFICSDLYRECPEKRYYRTLAKLIADIGVGPPAQYYSQSVDLRWWKREATARTPGGQGTVSSGVTWCGNLLHLSGGHSVKDTYMNDVNNNLDEPIIKYQYGMEEGGSREWNLFDMISESSIADDVETAWGNLPDIAMEIDQADCEQGILATEELLCGAAFITGGGDVGIRADGWSHLYWFEENGISGGYFEKPILYVSGVVSNPTYLDNRADTVSYPGEESNAQQSLLVAFKDNRQWRLFIQQAEHDVFEDYGVEVDGWREALLSVLPDSIKNIISGDRTLDDLITGFGMV